MALAEPRRRTKWTLNPRGNLWANDETKVGLKLMEKMGYQKGKVKIVWFTISFIIQELFQLRKESLVLLCTFKCVFFYKLIPTLQYNNVIEKI